MLMRGIAALVLVLALCQSAEAGALHRISCAVVRLYVAKYSEPAAESWARSHGATDVEIETARRCLGSSLQTASTRPLMGSQFK
jgi:ABC-type sulfate transport system substrate-binding protein